ncbi:TetR/AcrR family transcriptional regulator [Tunturiibacter lichenicola]|uniref:TetR/AcrR family transcriptional regulator n=1 Tax=Tunturiibacter lichenicola TaxID=2051959 RepID=UPI0021B39DDA|nr:TetR/AcrR family transcriptional regulator [Edaphobacter lichenicola]
MSKGDLTRQRIIEEAAPIFNQRGFAGCSMQDVLDATGLEKGGVYRHFASKEELAAEAFQYAWTRVAKARREGQDAISGTVEKLQYSVKRFAETPGIFPGGCPLMNTAIDADDGNPVLRDLVCAAMKEWKARLASIVEDGLVSGEIRGGVQPRRIANTIIATLEGALMISRLEGDRTAVSDARDSLMTMLDGIAAG